ncbi:MAG: malto-oligosyltrehalose synthase [Candidatus Caenarcaniphilales bacterium]|nr:malto-oligosyltrehalose synthase [Candidatus Caenarcaniphilales bacterium]
MPKQRPITSTYRLQLNKDFKFENVIELLPYFKGLGISHLYLSPIFQATPGSTHGYDITDFNKINSELGGEKNFYRLCDVANKHNLGIILDFVPNHMAVNHHNNWWMNVLKEGNQSEHFKYFDIRLSNSQEKICLPVLGESLEDSIEQKEFMISKEDNEYFVNYYENKFPLNNQAVIFIENNLQLSKLSLKEYSQDLIFMKQILDFQHYKLTYWKTGSEQINYRRFFNINGLIGTNMDNEEVFEASHKLLFSLIGKGEIDGVRIDHPDGLSNPRRYFQRFQEKAKNIKSIKVGRKVFYLLVEKILTENEELRSDWLVHGTTGYDFACNLNKIFVKPDSYKKIQESYTQFTKQNTNPHELIKYCKALVIDNLFQAEFNYLCQQIIEIFNEKSKNNSEKQISKAFKELLVNFPVYRTYIEDTEASFKEDEMVILQTIKECKSSGENIEIFDELQKMLLQEKSYQSQKNKKFIREFQQLTCSVIAKGIEDTFHYRFYPLCSFNEVGCEPILQAKALENFHSHNQHIQDNWPLSMTNTSTHDSKRSEDVRARINVLSEVPQEWNNFVQKASALNKSTKQKSGLHGSNEEYLFYQTLIGSLTFSDYKNSNYEINIHYQQRIKDYLIKSFREAKKHTSWREVNENYENSLTTFIDEALRNKDFAKLSIDFAEQINLFGQINSLSQLVLKLTSPGIPDIYQGNEFFQYQLVDPDNRQTVDYKSRKELLKQTKTELSFKDLYRNPSLTKLAVTQTLLNYRRDNPNLFLSSDYLPLKVTGHFANSVIAFQRNLEDKLVIVIVPTHVYDLWDLNSNTLKIRNWNDTFVKINRNCELVNIFTGSIVSVDNEEVIKLSEELNKFPVAILQKNILRQKNNLVNE